MLGAWREGGHAGVDRFFSNNRHTQSKTPRAVDRLKKKTGGRGAGEGEWTKM